MASPATRATAAAAGAAGKAAFTAAEAASGRWRLIPRPLLETVLHNHAHHHRVPQPLLLHGPRGVGKTSLVLHRLLPEWKKAPHFAAYVDFGDGQRHWAAPPPAAFEPLRDRLEGELEALVECGVRLGAIGSRDVFAAVNKWHGLSGALRRVIGPGRLSRRDEGATPSALWGKAVLALSARIGTGEIDAAVGMDAAAAEAANGGRKKYSMEEVAYMREAALSLRLAKEVIGLHQEWRREAVRQLNRTGGFSRSLANSATDWPCLLLEILSEAAEIDFFQV